MNKYILFLFFIIPISFTFSQTDPYDLEGTDVISKDIFLLWGEGENSSTVYSNQKVYKYASGATSLPIDERLISIDKHVSDKKVSGNGQIDVATGNFNSDAFDDIVGIWEGENGTIDVLMPQFDSTESMWTTNIQTTIAGPVTPYGGKARGRMFIRTGDFDADNQDEFIVAYHGADSTIHINVYDTEGTLNVQSSVYINDESLLPIPTSFARFWISTGDLDGDEDDEIILAGFKPNAFEGSGRWGIYVKVYDLINNKLVPKAYRIIHGEPTYNVSSLNLGVTTGQFNSDPKDEIGFVCTFNNNDETGEDDTFIYLIEASANLDSLAIDRTKTKSLFCNSNELGALSISAGDLNADERDELVFAVGGTFYVYESDDLLNLYQKNNGGALTGGINDDLYSYNFLDLENIDGQSGAEIVLIKNYYSGEEDPQSFSINVFTASKNLDTLTLIVNKTNDEEIPNNLPKRNYAIALGNFDGFDFRIGKPKHYMQYGAFQPLVILNAPPVHFDILNGNEFDINGCYHEGECDFIATYEKSVEQTTEVSTKVHKEWGATVGAELKTSAKVAPMGVGAEQEFEAHLLYKFGRQFSNESTSRKSITIDDKTDAIQDDQIFATVTDYSIWEYPVYNGASEIPTGAMVILDPVSTEGIWFPSKSWSTSLYVPNHEVGNIMSYTKFEEIENNPDIDQMIKLTPSITLGSNTSREFTVEMKDFRSSSSDTVKNNTFDFYASIFVVVGFDWKKTRMSTHKFEVTEELTLRTRFGGINTSYGETGYDITPYSYWTQGGVLVVDYATRPSIASPGFPQTWWQENYGNKSDPAFIMPWRYDPEKGFGISEEAKRKQTNDVRFSHQNPSPGDSVTISAVVRNFSLLPIDGQIEVKFYIGDPDQGGKEIAGLNGETLFFTSDFIPSRGSSTVSVDWEVPVDISLPSRIYAVIDPSNSIDEIHQNNNIGWSVFGRLTATDIKIKEGVNIVKNFFLDQNYPNPFNPTTMIKYSIPTYSHVTIKVFDILGREVKTLINKEQSQGNYELEFIANHLSSGVYFYRIIANEFIDVKKMILVR